MFFSFRALIIIFIFLFFDTAYSKRNVASKDFFQENSEWIKSFTEAQAALDHADKTACKKFKKLKKAPTSVLEQVVKLRELQSCKPSGYHLAKIDASWLKKEIIFFGLQNTKDPEVFLKYYRKFLKLDANSKLELEYLKRTELFKAILKKAKGSAFEDLIREFPSFYVDYERQVPEELLFEAAYGLRMQRRFEEARKIYKDIIRDQKKELNYKNENTVQSLERAYEFLRVSYRVQEQKENGILKFSEGVQFFKDEYIRSKNKNICKIYVKMAVQQSRDIWTEGRSKEARKNLEEIISHVKDNCELDLAYWVLGRMEQDDGNHKRAIDYFAKAKDQTKDDIFKQKLIWLAAWNSKKINEYSEAIKYLDELERLAEKNFELVTQHKALFWKAKILETLGNKTNAKEIYADIIKNHEFGYYGRLSLLEVNPGYWLKEIESTSIKMDLNDEIYFNVKLLASINEKDIASEYIQSIWLGQKSSWRKKLSNKIYLLSLNHEVGLYKENQQYLEIFDDDDKREILNNHAHLIFPKPYLDIVSSANEKTQVPVELIYSLMRQESLFDANARSPADAFGLLQLIPRVAHANEKLAGVKFNSPLDLYKPEVIVPLGAAHLSQLLKTFDKSLLLTVASYNAGVPPVLRWLKSKQTADVLEFIEDVPYAETETYVKLVFRNLSFYIMASDRIKKENRVDFLKSYFKL